MRQIRTRADDNDTGDAYGVWRKAERARRLHPLTIAAVAVAVLSCLVFATFRFSFWSDGNGGKASRSLPSLRPATAARANPEDDPSASAADGPYSTVADGPYSTVDDETSWQLILVNKWNFLPDDYEIEITELSNGQQVDSRIYPALQEMFDDARAAGVYPIVASGYRTAEKQQGLMDAKIAEYEAAGLPAGEAKAKAEEWVAIPGASEHQLGIAVDINADGVHSAGYEVYDWLGGNSYKYGFIRRYAEDKTEITGVINEPWHYRYVGIEAAGEIYRLGVCLEEYLDMIYDTAR